MGFSNKVSIAKHAVCLSSKYHVLTNVHELVSLEKEKFSPKLAESFFFPENYLNSVGDTVDKDSL